MKAIDSYQIITFYEFKELSRIGELSAIRDSLKALMAENSIKGTIIIAAEGFNSTVCGTREDIGKFVAAAQSVLETELCPRVIHDACDQAQAMTLDDMVAHVLAHASE